MAAHPVFIDPRSVEDLWRDVDTWLHRQDRTVSWLARRLGVDDGALCRMRQLQAHTPVDLYFAIVRELGAGVGRAPAERAGVELVPVVLDRPSRRVEDTRAALVATGTAVGRLAEVVADGQVTEDELVELRPDLEELVERLQALLRRPAVGRVGAA